MSEPITYRILVLGPASVEHNLAADYWHGDELGRRVSIVCNAAPLNLEFMVPAWMHWTHQALKKLVAPMEKTCVTTISAQEITDSGDRLANQIDAVIELEVVAAPKPQSLIANLRAYERWFVEPPKPKGKKA